MEDPIFNIAIPFLKKSLFLTFGLICLCGAGEAFGQEELLPKGIGIYQFGYRSYSTQTHKFNSEGEKEELGAPFSSDFNGPNLSNGVGGSDLKRLADELAKYDSFSTKEDSLLNQLDLGTMSGQVEASISARILGIAFGMSKNVTGFFGAPYIEADVRTSIQFKNKEADVDSIKDKLGDIAFDEIKDGLDKAKTISADQIIASIEEKGYAPIDHWNHAGWGDFQFGTVIGDSKKRKGSSQHFYSLKSTVNIPTGYYEDPNILTDVSLGKGYYGLLNEWTQAFVSRSGLWAGYKLGLGYNFDTSVDKRVPEGDEGIVAQDRLATVDYDPGHDSLYVATLGMRLGLIRLRYNLGQKQHYADQYSGSISGNYDKLSENTASYQTYHEASVMLQTMDLYRQKKFMLPFTLKLTGHFPIAAVNSQDENYYEVRLDSFFSTPMAGPSDRKSKRIKMKRAKRNQKKSRYASHH